jgi:hypothetical protein
MIHIIILYYEYSIYSVLSHYQIIHDYNTLEVHDNIYYEYDHINYHEPQVCCGITPKYGLGRQFQWHIWFPNLWQ